MANEFMTINGNLFKTRDYGAIGDALEMAIKKAVGYKPAYIKVSKPGKSDVRIDRRWTECKQGAGELSGADMTKLLVGSSRVLFVPVVVLDGTDGNYTLDPYKQEGFILDKKLFIDTLESIGAIREKVGSDGITRKTIQTFWNRSKNAPHGKTLERIMNALYTLVDEGLALSVEDLLSAE